MNQAADKVLDARGSFCPGPLMELIGLLKLLPVGATVEVLSSDRGSQDEIPAWTAKAGHEFLGAERRDGHWAIRVRKAK